MDPKPDKETTSSTSQLKMDIPDTTKASGFSIDDYALQYAAARGITPDGAPSSRTDDSSYSSNEEEDSSSHNDNQYGDDNNNSPQNIIAAYNRRASKTASRKGKAVSGSSKPSLRVVPLKKYLRVKKSQPQSSSSSSSEEEEEEDSSEEEYPDKNRRGYPGAKEDEESYREEGESVANSSGEEEEDEEESYDVSNYPMTNISTPGKHDVLFGRGGATNHHPGNKLFRTWVEAKKDYYLNAKRNEKTEIAMEIVDSWRDLNPPGRFLIKDEDTELFNDAGDDMARKKTAATLRETRCNNSAKVEAYTDIEYVPPPGPRRGGSGGGRRASDNGSGGRRVSNTKRSRTSSGRNLPRREDRTTTGSSNGRARSRSPMPPLSSVSVSTTKTKKRKSGGDWEDDYCLEYAEVVSKKTVKMKYGTG